MPKPAIAITETADRHADTGDRDGPKSVIAMRRIGRSRSAETRTQGPLPLVPRRLWRADWASVGNPDFRSPIVTERKQAECLLYESFPWELIEKVGVSSVAVQTHVQQALANRSHRPPADLDSTWYS